MKVSIYNSSNLSPSSQKTLVDFRNSVFSESYERSSQDYWSEYDNNASHFVVEAKDGSVVGYYRTRHFFNNDYSSSQASELFDLSTWGLHNSDALELSRAAVHPLYRDGSVVSLLWTKIAEYLLSNEVQYCFGTTSAQSYSPDDFYYLLYSGSFLTYHVTPLHYNYVNLGPRLEENEVKKKNVTTLLRAYCKQGALFAPYPAYDSSWSCYDYFTVFKTSSLVKKFRKLG